MRPALLLATCMACVACVDPVHDGAVAALGPEDPAVAVGPRHRADQPCLVCHGGAGPAALELSVGGTIHLREGERSPADGVEVVVRDARGREAIARTNETGNFHLARGAFDP
ncbi:MAG: hypothetical protein KF819_00005, partial [Labilithrix sp.]|nr:hypothetical protein [Labilithrix sp.]